MIGGDSGRPPSAITLDNWQSAPHLVWSFQHVADLFPTATISRGTGPVAVLLASEADAGITGALLNVDGGSSSW